MIKNKTRKLIIAGLSLVVAGGASAYIATSFAPLTSLVNATTDLYSIQFSNSKNKMQNRVDSTPVSGNAVLKTELNNDIAFAYTNIVSGRSTYAWQILGADSGSFYNTSALNGITTIKFKFNTNGKNFAIYYSKDGNFSETYKKTLTSSTDGFVEYGFENSLPHYFKVVNTSGSEISIDSMSVHYTCSSVNYFIVNKDLATGVTVTGLNEKYEAGQTATFTVSATFDYEIAISGVVSKTTVSYSGTNPYTFTVPAEDVLLKITKKEVDPLKRKLTFEQRYQKIWDTNGTVYNEQVMLYTHSDGVTYGELLYTPTNVLEVKDYLMTKVFTKDVDFEVQGRKIVIKNLGSGMPYLTLNQYNAVPSSLSGTDIGTYASSKSPSGYVLYSEYPHIVKKTVLVTYTHNETWAGHNMYKEGNLLPKTIAKLQAKQNINLSIYGDSNATGAVTSGYWVEDYEGTHPGANTLFHKDYDLQEGLPKGFKTAIENVYGVTCNLYNPSEGGQVSAWPMNKASGKNLWTKAAYNTNKTYLENWLTDQVPDLVVLVFGNNDITGGVNGTTFLNNIKNIINKVKASNPNAEFIISLPKRSNPLSIQDNITMSQEYINVVKEYVRDANGGVAFHDMTTITADLLAKKDPYSLLGNGINHSNDFLARQWVSLFINTLEVPSAGHEWNYDTDDTITHPTEDLSKYWRNVLSDTSTGVASNVPNGVNLSSLSSWGEGFASKQKLYLDGLEFEFRGNRMKYGGSVPYKDYKEYLLSTNIGFFFSKAEGNWTPATAYPSNGFMFNLLDIFGQNRIFVGANHDYNGQTIMYTDVNCQNLFSSNGTNEMVLNRLPNGDTTDHAGVKVSFKKENANAYSIKITSLYSQYFWENNPNYNASDMSCTYYIKASSFANVVNEDGSTYLNVCGYGPEFNGSGYGGDMSVDIVNLVSKEPAPISLGEKTRTYVKGSAQAMRFYYNPVVDSSQPQAIAVGGKNVDIANRSFGHDANGYYAEITANGMEYIAQFSGTGSYVVTLQCSNGTCSWNLNVVE